jgi:hypothetical protein
MDDDEVETPDGRHGDRQSQVTSSHGIQPRPARPLSTSKITYTEDVASLHD